MSKPKSRIKSRGQTEKEKTTFNIFVRLFTDEKFPLKNISGDMKIRELKEYMEFATGIPFNMQRISYLDDGDLLDGSDVHSNDIVPGATLQLRVWPMWKELIEAAASNDIDWVFKLGVTQPTDYRTPHSDYMTKRARKIWLEERAFLALFIAAHRGHIKLVKKLIDSGADVNASTQLGRTALHVAAAQGRGHIVDLLLERGADIDAEDEKGESALSIAAKFGHKTCERHLFLFRWQERAKRTKPSEEPKRMAHQYFDSKFPVWIKGGQCQLYFTNILPPGEFEGTRFDSPTKRRAKSGGAPVERQGTAETDFEYEFYDDELYDDDGKLPAIREERRRAYRVRLVTKVKGRNVLIKIGPASSSKRRTVSYDAWLARKKSIEQHAINLKKMEEEKKRLEEEDRIEEEKRIETEKSESYETWLAQKEFEKKLTSTPTRPSDITDLTEKKEVGYLRSYLRSLDEQKRGASMYYNFEEWLDIKEEEVLQVSRRAKTAV